MIDIDIGLPSLIFRRFYDSKATGRLLYDFRSARVSISRRLCRTDVTVYLSCIFWCQLGS